MVRHHHPVLWCQQWRRRQRDKSRSASRGPGVAAGTWGSGPSGDVIFSCMGAIHVACDPITWPASRDVYGSAGLGPARRGVSQATVLAGRAMYCHPRTSTQAGGPALYTLRDRAAVGAVVKRGVGQAASSGDHAPIVGYLRKRTPLSPPLCLIDLGLSSSTLMPSQVGGRQQAAR